MAEEPSGMTGVYAAAVTVFNDDLTINAAATLEHFEWLLDSGCDGVLVFGTTGEANSLSVAERLAFLKELGKTDIPRNKLMIGTGSPALPDSVALSRAAMEIGVYETLLLPPYYFKNPSEAGLRAYVEGVIDGVADEHLRILLYHFPQMAGVPWPDTLTEALVEDHNGVIVGMKDSSGDWDHMKDLLLKILGFRMFTGSEAHLSKVLDAGGPGTISATVNLTAPRAQKVFSGWKQEKDTVVDQAILDAQRDAFTGVPLVSAIKTALAIRRNKPQYRITRPPFRALSRDQEKALMDKVNAAFG